MFFVHVPLLVETEVLSRDSTILLVELVGMIYLSSVIVIPQIDVSRARFKNVSCSNQLVTMKHIHIWSYPNEVYLKLLKYILSYPNFDIHSTIDGMMHPMILG